MKSYLMCDDSKQLSLCDPNEYVCISLTLCLLSNICWIICCHATEYAVKFHKVFSTLANRMKMQISGEIYACEL